MSATSEIRGSIDAAASLDTIFAPVRPQTAFEEAVGRIGTAIRLGLLPPGTRLPSERELCAKLRIARSTLRQALVALSQSGHLRATRGRGGGTFVVDELPPAPVPPADVLRDWRTAWEQRTAAEVGIAVLACRRARPAALGTLGELVGAMESAVDEFSTYRRLDVRFHVGLAQATGNARLITLATGVQGDTARLISLVAHPAETLSAANLRHRRILAAVSRGDEGAAAREMAAHLRATEHILTGLLRFQETV